MNLWIVLLAFSIHVYIYIPLHDSSRVLWFQVGCLCVFCLSVRPSVFSFLDDNLSKYQWFFYKTWYVHWYWGDLLVCKFCQYLTEYLSVTQKWWGIIVSHVELLLFHIFIAPFCSHVNTSESVIDCSHEMSILIMPPNSKKLEGHIASGAFVCPSIRLFVHSSAFWCIAYI